MTGFAEFVKFMLPDPARNFIQIKFYVDFVAKSSVNEEMIYGLQQEVLFQLWANFKYMLFWKYKKGKQMYYNSA